MLQCTYIYIHLSYSKEALHKHGYVHCICIVHINVYCICKDLLSNALIEESMKKL